jgi:hypothetical protein
VCCEEVTGDEVCENESVKLLSTIDTRRMTRMYSLLIAFRILVTELPSFGEVLFSLTKLSVEVTIGSHADSPPHNSPLENR